MSAIYLSTYYIDGNQIRDEKDGSKTLSTFLNHHVCAHIRMPERELFIDISKMLLQEPNIVNTQTISAFVSARITTDEKADAYQTDVIPIKNPQYKRYDHRIKVTDGHVDNRFDIAYSSFLYPQSRNDRNIRSRMTELVLTPRQGVVVNLSNILVSVNGVFHKTSISNGEIWVKDGFTNIRNSGNNNICIYDTSAIGGHTTIPIITPMVTSPDGSSVWNGVYLSMPDGITLDNKTALVVIDGYIHILDGTYRVVSPTSIKLDLNKVDLVGNFINNPNTKYKSDLLGTPSNPYDDLNTPEEPPVTNPGPSVREILAFYLENGIIDTNPVYPEAVLAEYDFVGQAGAVTEITRMIPTEDLITDQFVYNQLIGEKSFIILINNQRVYKKTYNLIPTLPPTQYEHIGSDTPRGLLLYNNRLALAYNIISSDSGNHTVSLDYYQRNIDIWKTAYNEPAIPAPLVCPETIVQRYAVEIHELYSPYSA